MRACADADEQHSAAAQLRHQHPFEQVVWTPAETGSTRRSPARSQERSACRSLELPERAGVLPQSLRPSPRKAIGTRLAKGISRSQILAARVVIWNRFDPISRDGSFGIGADAAEPALGRARAQPRKDREQRALVAGVRRPEMAEEADLQRLVCRDRTSTTFPACRLRPLISPSLSFLCRFEPSGRWSAAPRTFEPRLVFRVATGVPVVSTERSGCGGALVASLGQKRCDFLCPEGELAATSTSNDPSANKEARTPAAKHQRGSGRGKAWIHDRAGTAPD